MLLSIEIDGEVLERLKEHAEPFVDTPNSVLRRILGLVPAPAGEAENDVPPEPLSRKRLGAVQTGSSGSQRGGGRPTRAKAGSILPEEAYEMPILEILREIGGRAATREVIDALGEHLDGRLTDADLQPLSSGQTRWRQRAQFVRLKLIERGDMVQGSPRGIWEISDQGRTRTEALS
jgi:hypothetical protein